MSNDRPARYVAGVVVPARIAYELEQRLQLGPLRAQTQGRDREFYEVLHALAWAHNAWSVSLERNPDASDNETPAVARETGPSSELLDTGRVANKLRLSRRRVQQLADAGELGAERVNGRWCFTASAVEEYRIRRAA